ncbi:hypothetical protein [Streptomyces sp. S.PB5]|uniref:Acg family FMN-binding oxidoreductase n=1 Tax=Streptomyces sp. S.PB5 TaxID=3020844 RepID=UPI0025B245A8|nr:hypothetical protein [Streptomyces sp. S.PB5]MDN3028973.1 hypothetical protein [Streptomyces sp. S.PB5]
MVAAHAPARHAAYYLVRAAVAAPSVYNTQPWRFISQNDEIELHADLSRRLAVADPDGREMVISCGAALFNLRLAMRHLGFPPQVRLCPDPQQPWLLATVRWGRYARTTPDEEVMFAALPRRHTHYGPFQPDPLPVPLVGELQRAARREGAELSLMSGTEDLRRLAQPIHAAETVRRSSTAHTTELANWTPPPGSARRDGLPAHTYPRDPDTSSFAGRDYADQARLGHANQHAAHLTLPALGLVVLLNTGRDSLSDWLRAGQALQHVLLHATAHHVVAGFHTQPLELPELRRQIRRTLAAGRRPQMILRLGYDNDVLPALRRPVSDVLIHGLGARARSLGEVGPVGPAPGPVRPSRGERTSVG